MSRFHHYDDIITSLGEFGSYQKKVYYIFCLPAALKATIIMSTVFILYLPDYRCALTGYDNNTYGIQNDFHLQQQANSTTPLTTDHDVTNDQCEVYDVTNSTVNSSNPRASATCDRWVYDTSEISSSIAMEYNLVCSQRIMRSHMSMAFFVGSLAGSVVFGSLADLFGRKTTLILCLVPQVISGIGQYFTSSLYAIIVLRAVQGMSATIFAISATIGMELVGPKKRVFAGIIVDFFWVGCLLLVPLVFYVTDDWRLYQLIWGFASLLLIGAICFLPESPRWLLEKGKTERANRILTKIAKSNKKQWSRDLLPSKSRHHIFGRKASIRGLLGNKILFIRSSIVFLNWFTVSFLYHGLTFNINNLHGSLYINYIVVAAGEVISYGLCFILLRFLGRRTSYVVSMVFGAIACLVIIFPVVYGSQDDYWTINLLATIGRLSSSVSYAILYIMTVELFPTSVRNSVLGLCSVFENGSGIVAPYIADLGVIVGGSLAEVLPSLVFGAVTLIAGLAALILPETKGKPLPENINEIMLKKFKVPMEPLNDGTRMNE